LFILQVVIGHIPVLGCLVVIVSVLLSFVLWLGVLVIHIVCIVKGVNGQRFVLPYISEYADKF
jgi:uncharacterized membrane protein